MPGSFSIVTMGLDDLQRKFAAFQKEIQKSFSQAGKEAGTEILKTQGLRQYPPATAANRPPAPFYVRGHGTEYASGENSNTSENLGKQWYTQASGDYGTEVGNRASYAPFVHGEEQARNMATKGWRKLIEVANDMSKRIAEIYEKWTAYTIKKLGL